MSDNPTEIEAAGFALPGHRVLEASGPDAPRFLQAQLMNDVAALTDGQWQWNGWLNPKGRLIALFALLRRETGTFWLLLPDADPAALADQLRRYLFRAKLSLDLRDDLVTEAFWSAPPIASASPSHAATDGGSTLLDWSGDALQRHLRIGPSTPTQPRIDRAGAEAWKAADLRHGLPRLSAAQSEGWTPQQLALGRLKAYSVRKGCYPGQEIVARTHFLGEAKRALQTAECEASVEEGAIVSDTEGAALGEVVAVTGTLAAWVGSVTAPDASVRMGSVPARVTAWQPGLAR